MNTLISSLAFGLALMSQAAGASATSSKLASSEMGCSASSYADAPDPTPIASQDGLGLRRNDASGNGVVRLQSWSLGDTSVDRSPVKHMAFERISLRVEQLERGIVSTPLVQSLMTDPASQRDPTQEPKLSLFLLAAAGVVAFVAHRRRSP